MTKEAYLDEKIRHDLKSKSGPFGYCDDCGKDFDEIEITFMVYEPKQGEVPICKECLLRRRREYEQECADKGWAVSHG